MRSQRLRFLVFKLLVIPISVFILVCTIVEATIADEQSGASYFFPYDTCIYCTVLNCSSEPTLYQDGQKKVRMDVVIDEVLRGSYRKGDKKRFVFDVSRNGTLPTKQERDLAGCKCVFAFDRGWSNEDGQSIENVFAPFFEQRFSDSDLQQLRKRLANNSKTVQQRQTDIQRYLENRWTVERIRDFCRPERRSDNPILDDGNGESVRGQLHKAAEKTIGKVMWTASLSQDSVPTYFINVFKGDDAWKLERTQPGLETFSDDDYHKYLLHSTLYSCLEHYLHVGQFKSRDNLELHDRGVFVKGTDGKPTEYRCSLTNYLEDGRSPKVLSARLDSTLTITSISIDGKPDKQWFNAYKVANETIETLLSTKASKAQIDQLICLVSVLALALCSFALARRKKKGLAVLVICAALLPCLALNMSYNELFGWSIFWLYLLFCLSITAVPFLAVITSIIFGVSVPFFVLAHRLARSLWGEQARPYFIASAVGWSMAFSVSALCAMSISFERNSTCMFAGGFPFSIEPNDERIEKDHFAKTIEKTRHLSLGTIRVITASDSVGQPEFPGRDQELWKQAIWLERAKKFLDLAGLLIIPGLLCPPLVLYFWKNRGNLRHSELPR